MEKESDRKVVAVAVNMGKEVAAVNMEKVAAAVVDEE